MSNTDPKTKDTQFYLHGKYFDSLEKMMEYDKQWADLPLDLKEFENQMQMRIQETKDNSELRGGSWTNRDAYKLLRMHTNWVEEKNVR